MNKVSIITICYNNKSGLKRTINSVLSQEYRNKEFIIIDGGSTDGSIDLIKEYKDNINIFVSEHDEGIYDALNKGIKMATGEWIVCMNAGDTFSEEDVLNKIFTADINQNTDAIYSDFWSKTSDGRMFRCTTDRHNGILIHQSCIYRKSMHDKYGQYVVTKPYIISDLLFMLAIPEERYKKVPFCISTNDCGGVSQSGTWAAEGALGLKVVYKIETMNSAYIKYLKTRITSLLPEKCKDVIRKYVLKKKFIKENK